MVDGIQKAISEKLVGHTGFTTHDKAENIIEYVKETDWCEIILFTYNILNPTYEKAIEAAHAKGIGVIVMNPLAGGLLAHDSLPLQTLADRVGAKAIPELAIRFLTSNPSVATVICGISKMSDVDSTIAATDRGPFTPAQMGVLRETLAEMQVANKVFCTGCRYCMPCSKEIDIPAIMSKIAQYRFWGLHDPARAWYRDLKSPKADA